MSLRNALAVISTMALLATCGSPASASSNETAAVKTPATWSDTAALEHACRTLQSAFRVRPAGGYDAKARISCIRSLRNLRQTAYGAQGSAAIRRILREDPSPAVRFAAADTLWGSTYADDGRALLESAARDPSPAVRGESFRNFMWPARSDIRRSNDLSSYDAVINAALQSRDPKVAGGALIARASLHGLEADAATRPFAYDRRALVRESAIDAYNYMGSFNTSVVCFIESRLDDPNPGVRSSVLLRLFRMGDHAAIPAIARLAKSAPTNGEREEAGQYLRAFATQTNFPHGSCPALGRRSVPSGAARAPRVNSVR